jgi:hypothetical protein
VSVYQDKSEENLKATELLINAKLNVPVVHCAYYSSLQLIINFVYEYCDSSEEEIINGSKNEGSHNFFINKVTSELKNINSEHALNFNKFINSFKRKRNEADYLNVNISEEHAIAAKERAEKVKKFFKIVCDDGKCQNIFIL